MQDNINRLMKLISIVQNISDFANFSQEQLPTQQNLRTIIAEGLQAIEDCSTKLSRIEYERNLYYKLLLNVAPEELEKLYNQIISPHDESSHSCDN